MKILSRLRNEVYGKTTRLLLDVPPNRPYWISMTILGLPTAIGLPYLTDLALGSISIPSAPPNKPTCDCLGRRGSKSCRKCGAGYLTISMANKTECSGPDSMGKARGADSYRKYFCIGIDTGCKPLVP